MTRATQTQQATPDRLGDSRVEAVAPRVPEASPTVFRLGELFAGPGGLGLGAHRAAIKDKRYRIVHQWANEYHEDTARTFARNIAGDVNSPSVVVGDVRTLDFERQLKPLGEIDGFAYGFPCNDFSLVGERKGFDGTFGPLYSYGVEVLRMFRPKFFLAENVSGLSGSNDGAAFAQIRADLENPEPGLRYDLTTHLYKFEEYGVPQARHRIIVVGIRSDLGVQFRVPSPAPFKDVDVSAGTALADIPEHAANQELTRQSRDVVERLNLIAPGQNAFTATLPPRLQIKTATKISQIYKRLDPRKPSYTITGSGGGGTHGYHWAEPRALTNRERARLQTFPDDFVFEGNKESVRRQIGMAVPVEGARIIFEAILKSFAGESYESIEPSFKDA
ncbi:DNA cytosine methyltransferase [Agrococcus sp. TSP3-2-1]|uniref:DNA cytosine methyltransferase n=1 Tax=Agrococcus sp. TSP3-2-1 TaxID=2804583 RepID=UPI003CF3470C